MVRSVRKNWISVLLVRNAANKRNAGYVLIYQRIGAGKSRQLLKCREIRDIAQFKSDYYVTVLDGVKEKVYTGAVFDAANIGQKEDIDK